MLHLLRFVLPFTVALTAPAIAQQNAGQQRPNAAPESKYEIRVNVNVNFFAPAPMNDGEALQKIQDSARRALYESALRECGVLTSSIASECKLQSISINMNRGQGQQYQEGYNASGNFSFLVKLK